jgi:hypothetical protein
MSTSVRGASHAAQPVDWSPRKPAPPEPPRDDTAAAKAAAEAGATRAAAPTRPATASLTQQDFELALRFGGGAAGGKTLDQLVGAPKIDRHAWDPVADRKAVSGFDRLAASLRNAAVHRDAAPAGLADTTPAASAPAETTAATAAPALAYRPLTADEYGRQYVLDAIAAYKRNSGLTPTSSAPAQPAPAQPAPAPSQPAPAPASPPPASTGSGSTGSTTPPPASPGTGTTTPPPAASGGTTAPPPASGGLLGSLFGR